MSMHTASPLVNSELGACIPSPTVLQSVQCKILDTDSHGLDDLCWPDCRDSGEPTVVPVDGVLSFDDPNDADLDLPNIFSANARSSLFRRPGSGQLKKNRSPFANLPFLDYPDFPKLYVDNATPTIGELSRHYEEAGEVWTCVGWAFDPNLNPTTPPTQEEMDRRYEETGEVWTVNGWENESDVLDDFLADIVEPDQKQEIIKKASAGNLVPGDVFGNVFGDFLGPRTKLTQQLRVAPEN